MFIFSYSEDWANIVIDQLAARHQTCDPGHWSYACLCVGRKFDQFLADHYLEIDQTLGPYLHVFSLLPPPREFVARRFQELRSRSDAISRRSKALYEELLVSRNGPDPRQMIEEKVRLLADLRVGGLRAGQSADFLFFSFRKNDEDIDIDVFAAATSPMKDEASPQSYFDLFSSMARLAEKHFRENNPIEAFVEELSFRWSIRLSFRQASNIFQYIKRFAALILDDPAR